MQMDNPEVKIIDFGLGKIIGPNEKCNEPFGTLLYAAPEIFGFTGYNEKVDEYKVRFVQHLFHLPNIQ